MPARALAIVLVVYTAAMLAWFVFVGQTARLEADVGARFVRISGWPTTFSLVGLIWTALVAGTVLAALRSRKDPQILSLGIASLTAIVVTLFVPDWFREFGYIGISTSEFLDATFLLLGGILPGGQAALGLQLVCVGLVALTIATALRSRDQGRVR